MRGAWPSALLVLGTALVAVAFTQGIRTGRTQGEIAGYAAGLAVKKPAPPVMPLSLFQFDTCGRTIGWLLVRTDGSAAYGAWADMEEPEQLEAVAALADKTGGLTILQFDCLM